MKIGQVHVAAIARRHGLAMPASLPEPWIGATSRVYPLDDVVIKIPFARDDAVEAVTVDATIAPFARSRGVNTPEILLLDKTGTDIPLPYSIVRRVMSGTPVEHLGPDSPRHEAMWRMVGEQLALIHAIKPGALLPDGPTLRSFRQSPEVDPRPWAEELIASVLLSREDGGWLLALLEEIAPMVAAHEPIRLCHGDLNAANVLVHEEGEGFLALIDWAGAGWLDPTWDFAGVPLAVVPWLLAGHRSVAPLPHDDTAGARICWCQIQTRLYAARSLTDVDIAQARLRRDMDQFRQYIARVKLFR